MNYLLDTHYMLWTLAETQKLSKKIRDVVTDTENRIIISTISFWEVSLKASIGKLKLEGFSPEDLPDACSQMGFDIVSLGTGESSSYHNLLATHHKDPFDRMLIWLALRNDYILISADDHVNKYTSEGLKVLAS
ncbi:MAG: twitching motility protein PilT [Sphingobacteriales bacterium 50-39]|nr:type II toxin-antitoxin system VapC family toxin [Sphingobacteriales bacterium]OJW61101.1 MAG: twitching motility protein PilT [Sphingobacteriales bacterium 50-39]